MAASIGNEGTDLKVRVAKANVSTICDTRLKTRERGDGDIPARFPLFTGRLQNPRVTTGADRRATQIIRSKKI